MMKKIIILILLTIFSCKCEKINYKNIDSILFSYGAENSKKEAIIYSIPQEEFKLIIDIINSAKILKNISIEKEKLESFKYEDGKFIKNEDSGTIIYFIITMKNNTELKLESINSNYLYDENKNIYLESNEIAQLYRKYTMMILSQLLQKP